MENGGSAAPIHIVEKLILIVFLLPVRRVGFIRRIRID
jgi:hypothetical protein